MHVVRSLAGVILIDEVDLVSELFVCLGVLRTEHNFLIRMSRTSVQDLAIASPSLTHSGFGTVVGLSQRRETRHYAMHKPYAWVTKASKSLKWKRGTKTRCSGCSLGKTDMPKPIIGNGGRTRRASTREYGRLIVRIKGRRCVFTAELE